MEPKSLLQIQYNRPVISILSQMNRVNTLRFYFFKNHSNIVILYEPLSS
jgi:hypothetical protein